jgi:D-glycero-alpha-D-manno-heptose 1-phosphate guanylyltransferase
MSINSITLDVMILAGGMGSRLKDTVSDRQKVVAAVNGKPFLFFLLEQLTGLPVSKLIFCTGHMHETVTAALKDYATTAEIMFSYESSPLGTGGALRQALNLSTAANILVMNGDSLIECDLRELLAAYQASESEAMMLLTEVADVSRFGMVTLGAQHRITAFNEKGQYHGSGLINAGVYIFKKSVIEQIPAGCPYSLEKQLFPALAVKSALYGYRSNGKFIDIGTAESYKMAQNQFS